MNNWKQVKVSGIARIEKCIAEFDVIELNKTPYSKFKVKVFENSQGEFTGYTNLRVKDNMGDFCGSVGHGSSVEEALKDTITYFLSMLEQKEIWEQDEFECSDCFDF